MSHSIPTRLLRLAAWLSPAAHRDVMRGMAAEYDWLESRRERCWFLLGGLWAAARITVGSWAGDGASWFGVALCGVALPVLDHHQNQPCLLIPASLLVPLVFGYESPRASWRWPVAFMLSLGIGIQLSPPTGYMDRLDFVPLLMHGLLAAGVGTFLRRFSFFSDRLA